jgi:hypothetical protein
MMLPRRCVAGAYRTWPPRQDFRQGLAREVEHDAENSPGHSRRQIMWQNRLNYSGSSVLVIAIQPILTQRTSNGTTHWSVGSPPDTTTVQQDQSRFTSHEEEFTIT